MTRHWRPASELMPTVEGPRRGRFDITFLRHGERSRIGRQYISYPYHFTRPFELDRAIPSLTTLYQQSSSGGLYRSDLLTSDIIGHKNIAAHVTTQASTIVHNCYGLPAKQRLSIVLEEGAFLAHTPDPVILFPGASLEASAEVRLAPSSVAILQDCFDRHDPHGHGESFDLLSSQVVIKDSNDRILARDRFTIRGCDLKPAKTSPVADWRIFGGILILGPPDRIPSIQTIEAVLGDASVAAGICTLPNAAGLSIRILARHSVALHALASRIFGLAVECALGAAPVPRRK